MECPVLKRNEELEEENKRLKKEHQEELDTIRQMLVDKAKE